MLLLAWLIAPLSLAVAIPHEAAHLLAARAFGVRVLEFGLGVPPRAASFTRWGIRWSVCWLLPLGAYVRLKGEETGTQRDDFAALPAWQRIAILAAGPLANLLVAALAAAALAAWGRPELPSADRLNLLDISRSAPGFVGWIGLGQAMDELVTLGLSPLTWFTALLAALSLGLGIANLLPVPPLDGGRAAIISLEAFSHGRAAVSPRAMNRLNRAGMVGLVALFIAVTGSDLARLIAGQALLTRPL